MSYETRYAAIKDDLRDIITEIAKPFGQAPEEYVGDNFGFEFGVDGADGEIIHVTLLLEDGADHGADDAGNVVIRVNHGEQAIASVAPNNFSAEAFAGWEDDELWDDKLDTLRVNVGEITSTIRGLTDPAGPKR
jgi:hypothetical protein